MWITKHGVMKELAIDAIGPLADQWMKFPIYYYCEDCGIVVTRRAPGLYTTHLQRRMAFVHRHLHNVESQLDREGLTLQMDALLEEITYAGNAVFSVNSET